MSFVEISIRFEEISIRFEEISINFEKISIGFEEDFYQFRRVFYEFWENSFYRGSTRHSSLDLFADIFSVHIHHSCLGKFRKSPNAEHIKFFVVKTIRGNLNWKTNNLCNLLSFWEEILEVLKEISMSFEKISIRFEEISFRFEEISISFEEISISFD